MTNDRTERGATPAGSRRDLIRMATTANASIVGLDNSRWLRILCGGEGSTDVIIDIVGYYA